MAFNFVKKIFSFGRKQVEEVAPDAPATDALPSPDSAPTPFPEIGPAQSRQIPETPETPVRPSLDETPPEQPWPVEPRAVEAAPPSVEEEPSSAPAAEILPPIREPEPIAPDPLREEVAPEPTADPALPPAPEPKVLHPEPGAPPAEPERAEPELPQTAPQAPKPVPATPDTSAAVEAPVEEQRPPGPEILQPIREPEPVPSDPLRAEVAPEPAPLPPLDGEGSAAGRGWGDTEAPPPSSPRDDTSPVEGEEGAASPPTPAPRPDKVTVARKVEARAAPAPEAAPAPRQSWFQRMRSGLSRSSRELGDNISGLFTKARLTDEIVEDLEEVLIRADLGVETAMRVTDALASGRYGRNATEADVRAVMAAEVEKVLAPVALPLELDLSHKPHVILVVGVNGTGKTTTIGKLAAKLADGGLSVMLAAGDTFRAAAIEQLKIWGERTGAPVIASKLGADAAGLAWDAFEKARDTGSDVLIIDTAGRLQNKAELMAELEKIVRVLGKLDPDAPHTVLQTVDATTGQNALNQVEIFRNVAGVNGLVMTKLDGTARGGILVAIAAKHKLPVYFIGVGEQVEDLEPFSANEFARAIAGVN